MLQMAVMSPTLGKRRRSSCSDDEKDFPLLRAPRRNLLASPGIVPVETTKNFPSTSCISNFPVLFLKASIITRISAHQVTVDSSRFKITVNLPMSRVLRQILFLRRKKSAAETLGVCLVMIPVPEIEPSLSECWSPRILSRKFPESPAKLTKKKVVRLAGFLCVDDYKVITEAINGRTVSCVNLELAAQHPFVAWEAVSSEPFIHVEIGKYGRQYPKWVSEMFESGSQSVSVISEAIQIAKQPHAIVCAMFWDEMQRSLKKPADSSGVACAVVCAGDVSGTETRDPTDVIVDG